MKTKREPMARLLKRGGVARLGGRMTLAPILALSILAGACGRAAVQVPSPAPECTLLPPPLQAPSTISLALLEPVDRQHAPAPMNASERWLFAHLYATLIAVDCLGRVSPRLAESWRARAGGRRWEFRLHEPARFWDGTPLTALAIATAWMNGPGRQTAEAAGIDSLTIKDERTLVVHLDRRHPNVPRALADLGLAVALSADDSAWPLGTGPYRPESLLTSDRFVQAVALRAPPASGEPRLVFRSLAGADPRDLLEAELDALVTADPALVEYAALRPELVSIPLPWDRTYVLLSTTRVRGLRGAEGAARERRAPLPQELRAGLARDAVRSEARGHRPPSWWHELEGCGRVGGLPAIPAGAYRGSGPRRLAYRRGDPAARDLAERLVALATGGGAAAAALAAAVPELPSDRLGLVAVGLELEELEERMRLGEDFAYVTDLPRRALDPCHERSRLASGAEWLALEDVPLAATLIPLVDTRRRLIARRGRAAGYLDWEGTVRIWAPAPLDVGR